MKEKIFVVKKDGKSARISVQPDGTIHVQGHPDIVKQIVDALSEEKGSVPKK